MKILFNAKDKNCEIRQITCENCGSELEIETDDIKIGAYGCAYVRCPVCGNDISNGLDDKDKDVTIDNIVFPDNFASYKDGIDFPNEEVTRRVKEVARRLIQDPNVKPGDYTFTASGNLLVIARYEYPEISVYVTKDYYESIFNA